MATRTSNERRFQNWEEWEDGGRKYWLDVPGKWGWHARYVKVVDAKEITLSVLQEIYDDAGNLVEVHKKYPVDEGHTKVGGGQ